MFFVLIAGNLERSALSSIQPNFVMPIVLTAEGLSSFLNNILKKGEVILLLFLEFFVVNLFFRKAIFVKTLKGAFSGIYFCIFYTMKALTNK